MDVIREQSVEEGQMLLLRKKLFFSDVNVDRSDPVQLNLLYMQVDQSFKLDLRTPLNIASTILKRLLRL